ncbi:MAG: C13 family peptidase [Bacteroidota bacterium]
MIALVHTLRVLVLVASALFMGLGMDTGAPVFARPASTPPVADLQAALLKRALGELRPAAADPSPSSSRLYFVGFASFGEQAVFKREVLAVRRLFDERFGTKGRSIVLINHPSTRTELPLASVANLEHVLLHLGRVMDSDRDRLFLFLTSHGDDGILAVTMPGLALEHLRPDHLKSMLDRSGIKNRVIVVSACHSGSFIPALAGPRTLVIAAARADRSSFGCEDRRRWTYFGDAYFNRALRHETSFRRAFEEASQMIGAWERRARLTPSMPQIAGGEALAGAD